MIDGEFSAVDWAVPDLVVTFPGTIVAAVPVAQDFFDSIGIAGH